MRVYGNKNRIWKRFTIESAQQYLFKSYVTSITLLVFKKDLLTPIDLSGFVILESLEIIIYDSFHVKLMQLALNNIVVCELRLNKIDIDVCFAK